MQALQVQIYFTCISLYYIKLQMVRGQITLTVIIIIMNKTPSVKRIV